MTWSWWQSWRLGIGLLTWMSTCWGWLSSCCLWMSIVSARETNTDPLIWYYSSRRLMDHLWQFDSGPFHAGKGSNLSHKAEIHTSSMDLLFCIQKLSQLHTLFPKYLPSVWPGVPPWHSTIAFVCPNCAVTIYMNNNLHIVNIIICLISFNPQHNSLR